MTTAMEDTDTGMVEFRKLMDDPDETPWEKLDVLTGWLMVEVLGFPESSYEETMELIEAYVTQRENRALDEAAEIVTDPAQKAAILALKGTL